MAIDGQVHSSWSWRLIASIRIMLLRSSSSDYDYSLMFVRREIAILSAVDIPANRIWQLMILGILNFCKP